MSGANVGQKRRWQLDETNREIHPVWHFGLCVAADDGFSRESPASGRALTLPPKGTPIYLNAFFWPAAPWEHGLQQEATSISRAAFAPVQPQLAMFRPDHDYVLGAPFYSHDLGRRSWLRHLSPDERQDRTGGHRFRLRAG